ncbi:threonine/serine exporter family protein [Ruminococcaceae bacterium OttesenSCG-928-L11]|nr:threonine/serine exporter family protein [Ruminococcaceae bacterium OttesenSCG-928-L11]
MARSAACDIDCTACGQYKATLVHLQPLQAHCKFNFMGGTHMTEVNPQETLDLAMLAGEILLENGAEIFRVQETVIHILEALGVRNHNVYVLSSGIFATIGDDAAPPCHAVRNVPLGKIHLGRITAVNELSREIAAKGNSVALSQYRDKLLACRTLPPVPFWLQMAACSVGCAGFCYILGGSLRDSIGVLLTGLILQLFLTLRGRRSQNKFIGLILGGALVTLSNSLILLAGLGDSLNQMIIGSIMPLVPGVALTTAIRDFFNGDYLSGTIHLVDALLVAACIAVGVGVMLAFWSWLTGVAMA